MLAPHLLRSALVLVNTRVDRVLGELQRAQQLTDTGLRALTQLFWSNVALHGTFERDLDKRLNYERGVDRPTPPAPSAAQVLPLCPVRPPSDPDRRRPGSESPVAVGHESPGSSTQHVAVLPGVAGVPPG